MKKIILAIGLITLVSCDDKIEPGQMYGAGTSDNEKIRYFYDVVGDKCFAERGLGDSYSFTCVPCDSAVKEAIKKGERN